MIKLRQETLEAFPYKNYTNIQKEVIPNACDSKDIYALAPTGSGKTYAYLLPILEKIELQGKGKHFPRCLILAPTRELCIQITHVIRDLLKKREGIRTALLTGGYDIQKQIKSFKNGADIVVGTPSRVNDHLRRHTFKTKLCDMLVIDEADMMLSMGFEEDVLSCISYFEEHQTMLFSATETKQTKQLASTILKDPFICRIQKDETKKQNIIVHVIKTRESKKIDVLESLLKKQTQQAIVFCNKRKTCDFITDLLQKRKYQIDTIHSEMEYSKRKKIMEQFHEHKINILCATDVASRGIDVPSVNTVILYDMSDTQEQLIHRIGRCSRDGSLSQAYIFLTNKDKVYDFKLLFEKVVYE